MQQFEPRDFGPVLAPLLAVDRQRPLDAGQADNAVRGKLEALNMQAAFSHAEVVDREMAACCIAGVWLLHDFLDESHTISQGIETSSGSYWHAIMHRREGDFGNSKYWYRRVGRHAVISELAADFDPMKFVDECEAALNERGDRERCLEVQQREWELLFDYCYRAAVGA